MPPPRLTCPGILTGERIWDLDAGGRQRPILSPQRVCMRELRTERITEWKWKHDDPIPAAFAAVHDDDASVEVDVLDPKSQTLAKPQPSPVQNRSNEAVLRIDGRKQTCHLIAGQHDGNPNRRARSPDARQPWQLHPDDMAI